jgi:AraC family transcriptional regulator, exoenzyme S synthesis regulatory protein ExsA
MINTYDFQVAHPDHFKQVAVKDLLFLYYKCPQEEKKINLYTHYNKIIYVLNGKKSIHHSNKSWVLAEDTSFFIRKTAYNQERFYDLEWEVLCFYLPDNYLQQVFKEYRSNLPLRDIPPVPSDMLIEIDVNEVTRAFYYSIVPYFTQQEALSESLLELKFRELIFNILSNPANSDFLAYVNSMNDSLKPSLQEIMESNYTFNLSLTEFARIAQRSLASFNREFRENYHTTPGKWLTQRRLNYAQLLLITSRKNVNEIAYDTGFENVTHFSRVFKEKFGLSPLQHRKQNAAIDA